MTKWTAKAREKRAEKEREKRAAIEEQKEEKKVDLVTKEESFLI